MALQSFGTNSNGIGANVRAPLGTTDSAFVDFGAIVSSSDNDAIVGTGSNQIVNVQGMVMAALVAIHLGDSIVDADNQILVGPSGYVGTFDTNWAIFLQGSNSVLDNHGTIWGGGGYGIAASGASGTMTIINSGTIEASKTAIAHALGGDVLVINNSGLITSSTTAIGGGGITTEQITNTGYIVGDIDLKNGDDFYNGAAGHLSGKVFGGTETDTIIGGIDNDWFQGGDDNDALIGNGGNDTLLGQDGNDTLNGGIGNDTLDGGLDNDRLFGGVGKDTLIGAANNDFFVFNTALNASTNVDTITDFNHVADTFQLENAIFTKLGAGVHALNAAFFRVGTKALDGNDYIVYNKATGLLSYDNDGNGAHAAIGFATLSNHPVLAANDFAVI
jgi:Ca2+-binding RTX toxin-like protein